MVGIRLALVAVRAGPARSAIVDVPLDTGHSGFQVEGDDLLWVDLSYTEGMTYPEAAIWADSHGFAIAGPDEITMLFTDIASTGGVIDIYEKNDMGAFVVSGYGSARGFFDDGTDNATVGEADFTYQTWFIHDDAKDPSYSNRSFGTFMLQVPEPSTLGLLALGGLAILRRRRSS